MRRFAKPFLLVGLAVVIVAVISWLAFPAWNSQPGGVWQLLGMVAIGVVGVVRGLVEILKGFPEEKETTPRTAITPTVQINGNGPVTVFQSDNQIFNQGEKFTPAPPAPENEALLPSPPKQGTLPAPGQLPTGSRMPFPRNAVFTGRETELLALADDLVYASEPGRVGITQPVAASGLGGIGKTQLAVEFCYRYGRWFEGVHWVSADDENKINTEIAACGVEMGLPGWPENQDEQVAATLRAWTGAPDRLIVMDNLEEVEALRQWQPRLAGVRILITTRRPNWPRELGVAIRRLEVLKREESRTLLRKLAPRLEQVGDPELDQLTDRLGHLPLAVDLAGRYLEECSGCSIAVYLAELEEAGSVLAHASQVDWTSSSPTGHAASLEATFALSWKRLAGEGETNRLARMLFQAAGYCAPNAAIPDEILWTIAEVERPGYERAKRQLADLGLFTMMGQDALMHPLLSAYARQMVDADNRLLVKLAGKLELIADTANSTELPAQFLPLLPHVEELTLIAEEAGIEDASALWHQLGCHKKMAGDFKRAKLCFERALRIGEKVLGAEHPLVATHVNNLGLVLQDLGDLAGAKVCYERALRIGEKALGAEHPDIATGLNNLGSVLVDLGDLAGAKDCLERALGINEKVLGAEHPSVATHVNNLGMVLQDLGDLAGAKVCYERALRINEKVLGAEHPLVAIHVNNLGRVLQDLGDLAGAKDCLERALYILSKNLPEDHPNIKTVRGNLERLEKKMRDEG